MLYIPLLFFKLDHWDTFFLRFCYVLLHFRCVLPFCHVSVMLLSRFCYIFATLLLRFGYVFLCLCRSLCLSQSQACVPLSPSPSVLCPDAFVLQPQRKTTKAQQNLRKTTKRSKISGKTTEPQQNLRNNSQKRDKTTGRTTTTWQNLWKDSKEKQNKRSKT